MFMVRFIEYFDEFEHCTSEMFFTSVKRAFEEARTFHPDYWWVVVEIFRLVPQEDGEAVPTLILTRTEGAHLR